MNMRISDKENQNANISTNASTNSSSTSVDPPLNETGKRGRKRQISSVRIETSANVLTGRQFSDPLWIEGKSLDQNTFERLHVRKSKTIENLIKNDLLVGFIYFQLDCEMLKYYPYKE